LKVEGRRETRNRKNKGNEKKKRKEKLVFSFATAFLSFSLVQKTKNKK